MVEVKFYPGKSVSIKLEVEPMLEQLGDLLRSGQDLTHIEFRLNRTETLQLYEQLKLGLER